MGGFAIGWSLPFFIWGLASFWAFFFSLMFRMFGKQW